MKNIQAQVSKYAEKELVEITQSEIPHIIKLNIFIHFRNDIYTY